MYKYSKSAWWAPAGRRSEEHSAHEIAVAELVVDLTNASGSQVGAVSATVERLPAQGTKNFQIPIVQRDVAFGLVRDVRAR
jgi:hypothetical protein